jgi:WD40 repeat protein
MNRQKWGLLLLQIGSLLYSIVVIYRMITGQEYYRTALLFPVLMVLALWKPRREGGDFLRAAFVVQALQYVYRIIDGFYVLQLVFLFHYYFILLWGFAAIAFLVAALFISNNQYLFGNEKEQQPKFSWKTGIAILLAISLPFLPRAEQMAWIKIDSQLMDNQVEIRGMQFSPDGKKLGIINDGAFSTINLWDMETREFSVLQPLRKENVTSLALSSEGRYLAIGQAINMGNMNREILKKFVDVELFDVAAGDRVTLLRTEPFNFLLNTTPAVIKVAFSPDNEHLACATGYDKIQIEVWDIPTHSLTKTVDNKGGGATHYPMAYSPDGKYLATEALGWAIGVWDMATGIQVQKLTEGYEGDMEGLDYSPDGKYIAVAFNKDWPGSKAGSSKGFIDIWDTTTGRLSKTLQWDSDKRIQGLSYSRDGKTIAAFIQAEDSVRIWDAASGRQIQTLLGPVIGSPVVGVAYSPDGKYLAVASEHYIKLYDAQKIGK